MNVGLGLTHYFFPISFYTQIVIHLLWETHITSLQGYFVQQIKTVVMDIET